MATVIRDISIAGPEIFLCVLALAVLVADLALPKSWRKEIALLAGLGMAATLLPLASLVGRTRAVDFSGAFVFDDFALLFKVVFVLAGGLTILMAADYLAARSRNFGEFFFVLTLFVLGLCFMASAGSLIIFYLAFELSSISGYILATWLLDDRKSNEAGLKYFIYGAVASAVMLYGLSLLYGLTGNVEIGAMADALSVSGETLLAAVAAGLVLVGIGYKIAMAPFHFWAPDVYEGAPTPVTAFLSVGPKLAGFALLARILHPILATAPFAWPAAIGVLSALTMFTGNLLAIRQQNIKRMLAYSSIAHAGYLLIGIAVVGRDPLGLGLSAVVVYAVAYLLMNLGAFAVAVAVEEETGSSLISAFAGLASRAPALAAAMVVFLIALTGIPPTVGFVGKLMLFAAAIKAPGFAWLAVLGIVNSVISLYYYMNVVKAMYFGTGQASSRGRPSRALCLAVWAALAGTLLLGIVPQPLLRAAAEAVPLLGGL